MVSKPLRVALLISCILLSSIRASALSLPSEAEKVGLGFQVFGFELAAVLGGLTAFVLVLTGFMLYYFLVWQKKASQEVEVYHTDFAEMRDKLEKAGKSREYDTLEEQVESIREEAHEINEKQERMEDNYRRGILDRADFKKYLELAQERRDILREELEEIEEEVEG